MTSKHTPGPWSIEYGHIQQSGGIRYWQITDGADAICCNQFCYAQDSEAKAAFIVEACNAFEANKAEIARLRAALYEIATNDEYRDLSAEEAKAVAQAALSHSKQGG